MCMFYIGWNLCAFISNKGTEIKLKPCDNNLYHVIMFSFCIIDFIHAHKMHHVNYT